MVNEYRSKHGDFKQKMKEIVGNKYGKLFVLKYLTNYRSRATNAIVHVYLVKCDCGREEKISRSWLIQKKRACGECNRKRRAQRIFAYNAVIHKVDKVDEFL